MERTRLCNLICAKSCAFNNLARAATLRSDTKIGLKMINDVGEFLKKLKESLVMVSFFLLKLFVFLLTKNGSNDLSKRW